MANEWHFQQVSLEQFTIEDWLEAQRALTAQRFAAKKRVARIAGIEVPAVVAGRNANPRVTFVFDAGVTQQMERIKDSPRLMQFNKDVANWGIDVATQLRGNVATMFASHGPSEHRLANSIESYVAYDKTFHKEVYRVGFRFARHGVHLHYGAGRGYGGEKGSRWMDRLGYLKETAEKSKGKMGIGARQERDWFNPVLEKNLNRLADIAADYCADMTLNIDYLFLG